MEKMDVPTDSHEQHGGGQPLERLVIRAFTFLLDEARCAVDVDEIMWNLLNDAGRLEDRMDDVSFLIQDAEAERWIVKREVQGWVERATRIQQEAMDVETSYEKRPRCLGDCANPFASYGVGKQAMKKQVTVEKLMREGGKYSTGRFLDVAFPPPPQPPARLPPSGRGQRRRRPPPPPPPPPRPRPRPHRAPPPPPHHSPSCCGC